MEKYFANYNQSLALKELGFDESCFGWYHPKGNIIYAITKDKDSIVNAPLKSQVFEWGRREYGLHHVVHHFEHKKDTPQEFLAEVSGQLVMLNDDISCFSYHSTYEEAESACIDKLIEHVKQKL